MLSTDGRNEWLTLLVIGGLLTLASVLAGVGWLVLPILLLTGALIAFFRDPDRNVPTQRGVAVAPADGRVSSIHRVEHYEPFDGPAQCVRIFLSVLDVHINRSPCHGEVASITPTPGDHGNALNPSSAEANESNLIVLVHPIRRMPVAAVRQVSGLLARTIVCRPRQGQVVQRGERIGMIKLGSTTELYLPEALRPELAVEQGQKVRAGATVLATLSSRPAQGEASPGPTPQAALASTPRTDTGDQGQAPEMR